MYLFTQQCNTVADPELKVRGERGGHSQKKIGTLAVFSISFCSRNKGEGGQGAIVRIIYISITPGSQRVKPQLVAQQADSLTK